VADQITVRALRREDLDAWQRLWDGYNEFYGRTGATALAPEITRATWSRFFDAYEPMHALVAEQNSAVVGFVHYLYHRSTTHLGPVCYLEDLYTLESVRGQGVASALIEAVYGCAREAGVDSVYWQTHQSNAVAMRLYDKLATRFGFIVYDKVL
jgi:GNAT superfamily N-acetyltransferase